MIGVIARDIKDFEWHKSKSTHEVIPLLTYRAYLNWEGPVVITTFGPSNPEYALMREHFDNALSDKEYRVNKLFKEPIIT